jgi:hypothetical protein
MVKALAVVVVLVLQVQMDNLHKVVMAVLDYIQQFQEQTLHILAVEVAAVVVVRVHPLELAV